MAATEPRSWIGQVTPHVVEVAVAGGAGGIVAITAEEPELVVAVDPVGRVAAAARIPEIVRQIWNNLGAIVAVLATGVRALDPSPRALLTRGGVRSVDPKVAQGAVTIRSGRIETPSAKEPEIPACVDPTAGAPTRARKRASQGDRRTGKRSVTNRQAARPCRSCRANRTCYRLSWIGSGLVCRL